MPAGRRQLFVYWSLDSAEVTAALQAARNLQQALSRNVPGLRCALYLRADDAGLRATLMETYAIAGDSVPDGIGPALQQRIEDEVGAPLSRWQRGQRHVEVFDACDG